MRGDFSPLTASMALVIPALGFLDGAQILYRPHSELLDRFEKGFAEWGELVVDAGWDGRVDGSFDEAVPF